MKSEHNASPAEDEEVIELTDILKSGSDAEEAIVELTDVVETVKAEPHDPVEAIDEDQPLELDELAITDDDTEEPLVDLTDALDPPEAMEIEADEVSDEAQALLELDDASTEFSEEASIEASIEGAEDEMVLGLGDALDTPEDEDTALDLEDTLIIASSEAEAGDDDETTAKVEEEIEVTPEALDLTEVLDAPEAKEDFLELDAPEEASALVDDAASIDASLFDASTLEDTLEVIEVDPVEDPMAEAPSLDEVSSFDEVSSLDEDGLGSLDLDELDDMSDSSVDTDEFDEVLDLEPYVEPAAAEESSAAESAPSALFGADDTGDDLDFKLDEMLAEAQAEMPDLDGDETDMELDLSEALADAAADSTDGDPEAILDLDAPATAIPDLFGSAYGDTAEAEDEEFDLISEDKIIELDDPVASETASKPDNVIELADVTGGYPTVSPTSELDADSAENDKPASAESLLEDVFLDEKPADDDLDTADAATEEDLDLGIILDGEAPVEEDEDKDFQLNEEMEKLEATLDDVFQDDDGDDMQLGVFAADAGSPAAESDESDMEAAPAAASLTDGAAEAPKAPVGDLPVEITEAVLDASVTRVIKTMYADRIEQMILDVIKEAVTAEIDKVKRSLGGTDTGAE